MRFGKQIWDLGFVHLGFGICSFGIWDLFIWYLEFVHLVFGICSFGIWISVITPTKEVSRYIGFLIRDSF